jgi:hypothetical protein
MSYEDFKLYPASFSKLNKFDTCPRQFESQYIRKDIQFVSSPATEWGSAVHEAFDNRFKTGEELTGRFESYEQYARILDAQAVGARLESEYELVVDIDGNRLAWDDPAAHMRGRIDVAIFYPDGRMLIADHKTGNRRVNDELEFFALLSFKLHPEVQRIKTVFLWYKTGDKPDVKFYTREDLPEIEAKFAAKCATIENALEFDKFPMKVSGLCKNFCGSRSCNRSGAYVKMF